MAKQNQVKQLFENHLKMTRFKVNLLGDLTEQINNDWVSELPEWCKDTVDDCTKIQPEIDELMRVSALRR